MFLPVTYRVNEHGRVEIGGCDLSDLAQRHGTPLYIYDEATALDLAAQYLHAMGASGRVLYSVKAFYSPAFLSLLRQAGLGAEVASGGELEMALKAGFAGPDIHVLGNNKSREEIEAAWRNDATLVIDGDNDLDLIAASAPGARRLRCSIRISPGVRPATHDFIATGQLDSKFGFALDGGDARRAVLRALGDPRLELVGLHFHVGSGIFDLGAHRAALEVTLDLARELKAECGWAPRALSAGGGLGIAQLRSEQPPAPGEFVQGLLQVLRAGCAERGLDVPELLVEPGRSIAGPSGLALYRVGAIKSVPGVRRYVAVDGGMGDNLRPKLYGARYEPLAVQDPDADPADEVTIVGRYCESTDVLAENVRLPELRTGDLVVFPAAGAYHMSMASNYNGFPRPAVVLVGGGQDRLIRRRETMADLLSSEVF
ncbi:MAG TPA: diaminopimelate decarboxylase [Candidatus Nitrosotalea sp.]|nr:diaminopimelate decarboxylase [Candidatus Nitrosotalea sp.]